MFQRLNLISKNKYPDMTWLGYLTRYMMRLNVDLSRRVAVIGAQLGTDYVGVHIRRTDKITSLEAASYDVHDYMQYVPVKKMLTFVPMM